MSTPIRSTKLPEEFVSGVISSCAEYAQNNDDNNCYIIYFGKMSLSKMFFSKWELDVIREALTTSNTTGAKYVGVISTITRAILNFRSSGTIVRGVSLEETNPTPEAPNDLDGIYDQVMAGYKNSNNI